MTLLKRAGHRDYPAPARPRHHRAALLGRALRRRAVAALADGRCSGGFTPEATGAARHARVPELSVVPAISGRASLRALRVLDAAERSGGTGRPSASRSGETRLES